VVFPDPVPPTIRISPAFRLAQSIKVLTCFSVMPSSVKSFGLAYGSSIRITTLSPSGVEVVDILKLKVLSSMITANAPSCGLFFSAISRPPITLKRDMSLMPVFFFIVTMSFKSPSTRNRTTVSTSLGSIWISLALSFTALPRRILEI